MKKSQLLSQPIIYIFMIVVAALILLFGISAIKKVGNLGEKVEVISFKQNLQKEITNYYYLNSGSSKNLQLTSLGSNYICFVDQDSKLDENYIPEELKLAIKTITNKNIFFTNLDPIQIDNMKPIDNPLCKQTDGSLNIKITSRGSYVEVS